MATASNTAESNGYGKLFRLILVGKTGVGKSSFGNVLLERKDIRAEEVKNSPEEGFVVCHGMASGTEKCCFKMSYNTLLQRHLEIIDTPGLFDTRSNNLMKTLEDFTKMLSLSAPGPHALLFLVRCDVKFTKEEKKAFDKIINMFKDNVLKHMVVVFTHGESLKIPIQTVIDRAPESLKKVLKLAENKYTVMSKTENMETRKRELNSLFSIIDKLSDNGKKYFSDSTLKELNEIISKEAMKKLLNKEHSSYEEALQKAKESISNGFGDTYLKVLLIVLGSAVFAILIGLTSGLCIFALPFATGAEALFLGSITSVSAFLTSLSLKIKSNFNQGEQTCVIS